MNLTSPLSIDDADDERCQSPDVYFRSLDVRFFGLSLIIPVGLVCNSLSLTVFMSRAMRRRASSWYLAALAVSDNLSLVAVAFDYWLKDDRIGIKIIKSSSVVCVTVSHLSYASRLLSAILVATFTVERFIGVVYPLRRTSLLSVSHARRVIGTEALVCAALATFTTFTIGIDTSQKQKLGFNDTDCDIINGMAQIYAGFNVAFLIVGSIIAPVLIVVALNAAILTRIFGRDRLSLFGSESSTHEVASPPNAASHSAYNRHYHYHGGGGGHRYEYNVTLLLLVVSTSFVVLNVPYCVCWFLLFFKVGWNAEPAGTPPSCADRQLIRSLHAAKYIASVPYFLNYGINFALYSVCARAFRTQLCRLATVVRRRTTCQRSASPDDLSDSVLEGLDAGGAEGYRRRLQMRRELAAARLKLPGLVGELGPIRMRTTSEPPSGKRFRRNTPREMEEDGQVSRVATN